MPPSTAAQDPTDIPAKGWKDIAIGVKDSLTTDHVGLIAAGVAFYALLAIFPMISALMALAGLVLDPAQVTSQLASLTGLLPEEAGKIILKQAQSVAGAGNTGLGLTFIIGLILAIYSASKGMGSLIEGLNVAYGVDEGRGFVNKLAVTLALTLFLIFGLVLGLTAAVLAPAVLSFVALPDWLETTLSLSRWLVLALLTILGLAVIYRYGPARRDAAWVWLTPGAVAACLLWIIASVGFSIYVSNFGNYNQTFGSVAGVIVLMTWLWMSAFIVLLGAELNAEIEAEGRD